MTKNELESMSSEKASVTLILEKYQENMIKYPLDTKLYTRQIVYSGGKDLTPVLMMAKVNALLDYFKCANQ